MIVGTELLQDISTAELNSRINDSTVAEHYRPGLNFENILDATVSALTTDEAEQHAYKYVLGKIFARRRHEKAVAKKGRDQ